MQASYTAMLAAFGEESKQTQEVPKEVSKIRGSCQQAKSASVQIRGAERKLGQKEKEVEAVKVGATAAAEVVCDVQKALEEADAKVAVGIKCVKGAEIELWQKPALESV